MERRTIQQDRRKQSLSSILYGSFQPRRRWNRRPADDQAFVIDWHDPGLFALAMSIVVMSVADAWFTLQLLALGGSELNWLMDGLLQRDVTSFLITKYCLTGGGVIVLVATARFRLAGSLPVRRVLEGVGAIYACLMIYEVYLLVFVAGARLTP